MQEQEYDSSNSGILTYRIQVKILLIVCILGFIGFAVFSAIAEVCIGAVFFAALALISFIYLLEICVYRLTYHGITISIKKLFSTKEYLASEIIELTKDQLDDFYLQLKNAILHRDVSGLTLIIENTLLNRYNAIAEEIRDYRLQKLEGTQI